MVEKHEKLVKALRLEREAKKLKCEVSEEQDKHRKTLVAKYKHTAKIDTIKHTSHWSDLQEGDEYLVITSYLTNTEDYDNHMTVYDSIMNRPDEKTHSVKYYRIHGVLLHEGGGYLRLKDKCLCSDTEWAELKSGVIPKKFKKE